VNQAGKIHAFALSFHAVDQIRNAGPARLIELKVEGFRGVTKDQAQEAAELAFGWIHRSRLARESIRRKSDDRIEAGH
jgi:hypothetical protein